LSILKIPTAKIFEPLLAPARYKGAYGGRGSGKSHFFGELLVETCQAERGTLAVCIREAQRTLAQSSKRLIESKIAALGLGHRFRIYHDKIETPGDGLIIFRGMQDHTSESIKSLEGFGIAWVDEAQNLSARSLSLLRPTIRTEGSELWASWNPRRKSDAIDDFFWAKKPAGAIVVGANWRDNPWFPAVLEHERKTDLSLYPDRYDHIWEGDYVRAFEGAYFAQMLSEARAQGRIGKVAADPLLPLRAFIDIGGSGATADAFTIWIVQWVGAEAWANDPDAARFLGFEAPPARTEKTELAKADSEKAADNPADPGVDGAANGLDPEIEKVLNHPQVRQAIEERIGEAEKTRQGYVNGLAAATQIAQVSFLSQFPELASIAPENLPGALELMSRQDPQKFARVQAVVATTEQLFAQQQQESRRQAELGQQNFQRYANSEDARLETMLKEESKTTQHAVTAEIFASAKASGVEPVELIRLFNSEPLMRNAVFQRMMYDAGKYRLMMKARDAAAAKPVPPVQRPGLARTPAEREHADLRTLSAKLSSSGDIKDALALYNARKSSKR
jgi:Phage terminase large subunit